MPREGRKPVVEIGGVYGRLKVLAFSHHDSHHRRHYHVRCECGTEKTVQGTLMKRGNTTSCGCWSAEKKRATRLPNMAGEISALILNYRRHAKGRGLVWELARSEVESLIFKPCNYCGAEPSNMLRTKNSLEAMKYSGIDRVNNSVGYFAGNCVPCCAVCNRAKQGMSVAEFAEWARRLGSRADQWGGWALGVAA